MVNIPDPVSAHNAGPLPCPDHLRGREVKKTESRYYIKDNPDTFTHGSFVGTVEVIWPNFTLAQQREVIMASIMTDRALAVSRDVFIYSDGDIGVDI